MTININTPASGQFDLLDIHLVESLANEIYAGTPERVTTVKKQTVEIRSQQATLTEKLPDNSVKTGAAQLPSVSQSIPETVPSAALDSMVQELSQAISSPDFHLQKALSGLKGTPAPTASIPNPNSQIPGSVPSFYFLPTAIPKSDSFPVTNSREIFDVEAIRQDFPILHQQVNGKPLIWFDNAATTQKPQSVIDALSHFYEQDNSNIHRAAHTLAARSTQGYEDARSKIQHFLGASSADEIIFARGTTEAINLVAQTYGRKFIEPGDEILLTNLEHHANIVPWQMLAQEKGAVLKVVPVNDQGEIILEEYGRLLSSRTKLVGLTQVSNAIGTILPVQEMTAMAHRYGARVLIDGAQSVSHIPVNVQTLNCDFYTFSGHKIFGPTGIGVLYGKRELLEDMPPWQGGGSMIRNVTFAETIYSEIPAKFEAGTPNIGDAIGLGYAIDYVTRLGLVNIERYEQKLTHYATERLAKVPGLRQIGTAAHKVGVLSFVLEGMNTEEVGKKLDREGIAVRAGHHCAQPTMQRFGLTGTVRPALAFYNTCAEIDRLIDVLHQIRHRY